MILSIRDFELLKLICWCKNIPAPAGTKSNYVYDIKDILTLKHFNLVSISRDEKNIRPRTAAYKILNDAGINFKCDAKPQTKASVISRRNIASQILLTFYTAGISVFNDKLDNSVNEPVYLASFAARQNSHNNLFGSTKLYGVYCTTREAYMIFHIDNIGVYFKKELNLFYSLLESMGMENTAIIIMGETTTKIASDVFNAKDIRAKKKYKTDSFPEIFETTLLPVHFIPIGDAGAQMLKLLTIPNYRETIVKATMKSTYKPPYDGMSDTDAIHNTNPYNPAVIAVDMDVKRIDRALQEAKSKGFERIAIYALSEQLPFLRSRYGNAGNAVLGTIRIESIKNDLDYDIELHTPPLEPYVTKEGRCFDVSHLAGSRKTGRQD